MMSRWILLLACAGCLFAAKDKDKDKKDSQKETRQLHKMQATYNHDLTKQMRKDRNAIEKQRRKKAKSMAKAAHGG